MRATGVPRATAAVSLIGLVLSPGISARAFDVVPFEVVADDGTPLRGHVHVPGGDEAYATILELSPYWNTHYQFQASDASLGERLRPYGDAGFAVALVNMRGTGLSGGCLDWGGALDASDAFTIVEALAGRNPERNAGTVGMIGLSYAGWSQYLALKGKGDGPPAALRAIHPVSGIQDPWSVWTRHGAAVNLNPFAYPAVIAGVSAGLLQLPSGRLGATSPEHLACPGYAGETVENEALDWNGDRTPYWQERDLRPAIADAGVPAFVTNGMTFQEGHVLQFEGLWDRLPPGSRMLVGQWGHGYPQLPPGRDLFAESVAWFDHHLRGGPADPLAGKVEFEDDSGGWHVADAWPPPAAEVTLHLGEGVLVAAAGEVSPSATSFVPHDFDPRPERCPGLQALYVSPPLAEDVLLAGNFVVDLTVTSSMPDGNLAAFLFHQEAVDDCLANGMDTTFTGGYPTEVRRALTDLRHRDADTDHGEDFPVAVPTRTTIRSHPVASVARAGERLILAVGGGAREILTDARKPVLTVSTGTGLAGSLRLPVASGNLRFATAP